MKYILKINLYFLTYINLLKIFKLYFFNFSLSIKKRNPYNIKFDLILLALQNILKNKDKHDFYKVVLINSRYFNAVV